MNTYRKFCAHVFVAQCEQEYQKGETIILTTKRGKENEHIVHNLVKKTADHYFYSITRADGTDSRDYAEKKVEKLNGYAANADKRSAEWREKSNEGKDFLALGEPIKIGHHSENRHRNLIKRNWNRMKNSMDEMKKAESYRDRTAYWERLAKQVNLSMPESLYFFTEQLEEAKKHHAGLKDGSIPRQHSYSLTYAKKRVNELTKKLQTAQLLWGDEDAEK